MYKSEGTMDLDSFTDAMNTLLSRAWGNDWGVFMLEEPTDTDGADDNSLVLPAITFDTVQRTRSASHPSLDPVKYETLPDPTDPKGRIKVYRMWFDVDVEFKILHESNRNARVLMEEFEEFLFTFKSYFKQMGISDMIFQKETKPEVVTKWQRKMSQRTLRYLVRIERILTIRSNILNELDAAIENSPEITLSSPVPQEQSAMSGRSSTILNAYRQQFRINE